MTLPAPARGIIRGRMAAGGNVYDKYATRNPVERRLVGGFMAEVRELAAERGRARRTRSAAVRGSSR